ncbi:hypothetical protein KP509_07G098100 [Ceratopteris richardii]|uniref:Codanin-1 C-terminal domain-containing protein n=1 Tax=Ceratopteris richardii TaxID=49495 RepID=A0A8T2UKN7_CERRI|nr:hypothetical protein KP509_07G098100 [Ceratopteris richardii]
METSELQEANSSLIQLLLQDGGAYGFLNDVLAWISGVSATQNGRLRRVNPTPMECPVVNSAFVFAKVEPNKQSNSSSPCTLSSAPLKFDMEALMKRCDKRRSKHKVSEEKVQKQLMITDKSEHLSFKTGSTENIIRTQRSPVCEVHSIATVDNKASEGSLIFPDTIVSKLKRFATVHSQLVKERLVPSLIGELRYLFQLVSLGQSTMQLNDAYFVSNKLFGCGNECSLYACIAMEYLGRVIDSVGEPLLIAMIDHPMIMQHAPTLLMQIRQSLARSQASSLHSFKSYKASNLQASHYSRLTDPISLPFKAERDSRIYYKSRESQKLYNNRELCRDSFYAIIREAAAFQNSFGHTIDDTWMRTQQNVKSLMSSLMFENYPWFTELILEHLIQVAVCGETDPVVSDFARHDPIKLQKLHDRLILGNSNKSLRSSSSLMHGNKDSNIDDFKRPRSVSRPCSPSTNPSAMELISTFAQSLRVYFWIMEAADSYKLSIQMIWSLKSKIYKLTKIPQHSRDSAEIGSILTQRVLSLKALASLLGFLCFSPGLGFQIHGLEWESLTTDPPIDVVESLAVAMANENLLLTLPWILDYLQLIKTDPYVLKRPYFQRAINALQQVYNYSILDPKNDNFGISSLCILSLLDRFFESVNLSVLNGDMESGVKNLFNEFNECTSDSKQSHGLDKLRGVVDTSYIQQCCPTLMELRAMLTNQKEDLLDRELRSGTSVGKAKNLRKITPIQNPKGFQACDKGIWCGPCEMDMPGSHMQMKLQQSFFEQHQELQRLVDFIVDTTAVNAARAASSKALSPILEEALSSLESTLAHRIGDATSSQANCHLESEVENIITSCIQKALPLATDYAKKHTSERASGALALLSNPDENPSILGIAARIAVDSAASAASKKTLAAISCDIRKKVTQEVESWRHNITNAEKLKVREVSLEKQVTKGVVSNDVDVASKIQRCVLDNKENMEALYNIMQKDNSSKQENMQLLKPVSVSASPLCNSKGSFLLNRVICCSDAVIECCENLVKVENQRHKLRVKLAATATSLEIMLSPKYLRMPPGGFGALVYMDYKHDNLTTSRDVSSSGFKFRIERALAKRCVTLAFHLCLQCPDQAFSYDPAVLKQCRCFTKLDFETKDACSMSIRIKGTCCDLFNDEKRSAAGQILGQWIEPCPVTNNENVCVISECENNDCRKYLMSAVLGMCLALENCSICDENFFILEFFHSWRWIQAVCAEPWIGSEAWFQIVKHGMAKLLVELCYAKSLQRRMGQLFKCLEEFFNALFQTRPEDMRNLGVQIKGETDLQSLKLIIIFVFLEMLDLDFIHRLKTSLESDGRHEDLDLSLQGYLDMKNLLKGSFSSLGTGTVN